MVVNGFGGLERKKCCIINVYAPCPLDERLDLWGRLTIVVQQNDGICICVVVDFNSVRFEHERNGSSDAQLVQKCLLRSISDHCPLSLGVEGLGFGAKSLQVYKRMAWSS